MLFLKLKIHKIVKILAKYLNILNSNKHIFSLKISCSKIWGCKPLVGLIDVLFFPPQLNI